MKKEFKNVKILKKTVRRKNGKILKRVQDDMGWFRCDFSGALAPDKNFSLFTSHLSPTHFSQKAASRIIRVVAGVTSRSTSRVGFAIAHTAPYRKFGFTLAEVLITLGIIGIVAAMTMPTLIQNYKKKVILTHLKKSYAVIQNAFALSAVNNGEFSTWPTGESIDVNSYFNIYLKPYFNGVKLCNTSKDCGYDARMFYNSTLVTTNPTRILFQLNDGTIILFMKNTYDSKDNIVYTNYFYMDVNGAKKPNETGKDVFMLQRDSNAINAYNSDICTENDSSGCLKKIIESGWEFPKDYPYKL